MKVGAPKGAGNGNYKKHILYNGKLHSLSELVVGTDINPGTLRSRLYRTAERKYIKGQMCFVCTDKYLRPQGKPGKRSLQPAETLPFNLTRYSVNVDGDLNQLELNKHSQQWLSKSIRISA